MQATTIDSATDSNSAVVSNGIRIDRVLLLTGTIGLGFLLYSWMLAIGALGVAVFGAYLAIRGEMLLGAVLGASTILIALGASIARWAARGVLEGRKARAIVACILMIGLATVLTLNLFLGNLAVAPQVSAAGQSLVQLVLALLLIWTFRDQHYWGRAR
jgi:hypothetical protein